MWSDQLWFIQAWSSYCVWSLDTMVFLLQVMQYAKLNKHPVSFKPSPLSITPPPKCLEEMSYPEGLVEDLRYTCISIERSGETTLAAQKLSIVQAMGCSVLDSEGLPWVHVDEAEQQGHFFRIFASKWIIFTCSYCIALLFFSVTLSME